MITLSEKLPLYEKNSPSCPVRCVTPKTDGAFHRFFDTPPFSPSGRYLAAFVMPFEDRTQKPGDEGSILVVDLLTGEETIVGTSKGWEPQMGANLQWGKDDDTLIYNDLDTDKWTAHCVKLDWRSGRKRLFDGWVYQVSPDGTKAVASDPITMRRTQSGYGVVIPDEKVPRRLGPQKSDGIYITDLESGERKTLISSEELFKRAMPESEQEAAKGQEVYFFHSKWNAKGTRIMFSTRRFQSDGTSQFDTLHRGIVRYDVFTIKPDGSELYDAIPADLWERGGHHTTWMSDGERLSFNLGDMKDGVDLMQVRFDGSDLGKICERTKGSGHPSENPVKPGIFVTDTYAWEGLAYGDGTTPIRLIDSTSDSERRIIRIRTATPAEKKIPQLRVDPHVVWDKGGRFIAFNAFDEGTRKVYVADLKELL